MSKAISLVVSGVSLVVDIVGLSIPFWLYAHTTDGTYVYGLWQVCAFLPGRTQCATYEEFEDMPSSLAVARAMEIIGMLILVAAVGCFAMKLFVMKQQNLLPKIGAVLAIIAGTFAIIGCVVFAAKFKTDYMTTEFTLHAGFGLCIVAAIGAYASAVVSFVHRRQE